MSCGPCGGSAQAEIGSGLIGERLIGLGIEYRPETIIAFKSPSHSRNFEYRLRTRAASAHPHHIREVS
jgi:hypothetical protein